MSGWTMKPAPQGSDYGWIIRGEDGRTVCHVQYEKDARTILDAVAAYKNGTNHKEN